MASLKGTAPYRYIRALRNVTILILFILVALFLRGCVVRPATDYPGSHFNRGKNAAWIGIEWVNARHTQAEIAALGNDLQRHQIAYAFVYVSYFNVQGDFNASYDYASDFIRAFKQAQPGIKLLAWYGLPLSYVDLSSTAVREKIAVFSANLIERFGFDGVHLDPEPVGDNDQNLLVLLNEIRQRIPAGTTLSIATNKAWPVFPDSLAHWLGPELWSAAYFHQVAQVVDQVVVMTYDSSLVSPHLYRLWSRFQVIQISRALADTPAELLMGVPTSEEKTTTHDPAAENMLSGLQGVIDGLNDQESQPATMTGVAIYPYWETDAAKWAVYESLWLGRD